MIELNKIYNESCLDTMKRMDDNSINMVMTSPPYWALRDYGTGDDQLGLEPTFDEYIKHLCDIFDEVKRILRSDGTCWVNLGDTYSGSGKGIGTDRTKCKESYTDDNIAKTDWKRLNYPAKNLIMIPFRFAIEMVNRGWILRNTIIWHKNNCMPSSIKDRFTVDFEYLFFFSKNRKYYFEQQLEPIVSINDARVDKGREEHIGKSAEGVYGCNATVINSKGRNKRTVWTINPKPFTMNVETDRLSLVGLDDISDGTMHIVFPNCPIHGDSFDSVSNEFYDEREVDVLNHIKHIYSYLVPKQLNDFYPFVKNLVNYYFQQNLDCSFLSYFLFAKDHNNEIRKRVLVPLTNLSYSSFLEILYRIEHKPISLLLSLLYLGTHKNNILPDDLDARLLDKIPFCNIDKTSLPISPSCICQYYNKTTKQSSHFAVYPEELCEIPIKAGCPEFVCKKCGKPREKIYKKDTKSRDVEWHNEKYGDDDERGKRLGRLQPSKSVYRESKFVGYTDCGCNAGFTGGIVYDPFTGSGTTGLVAHRLNRKYILSEMKKEYCEIAEKRLRTTKQIQFA